MDQSSDKDDSVPSDTNFVQNSPEHTSDHDTPTTETIIEHSFPSFVTSQHALVNYVLDNNLITLVSTRGAFIVQDRSGKYCVTLFPNESCQCPSTTTCFHILAAKMRIGQEPIEQRPVVRLLTKNTHKRVDKKSGKKQPRPNDYEPIVEPAPDSAFVTNTPKTPSSILSTNNTDKQDEHKYSRKKPISKKKLHFNLDTIQEDRSSCSDDFPDLPDLHCPFIPGNKRPAEDVSTHTPESLPTKRSNLNFLHQIYRNKYLVTRHLGSAVLHKRTRTS